MKMNLNAFWICLCIVVDLLDQMHALLLFVRDETTLEQFAVELESPESATLGDLLEELARCKAVNRNETHMVLSFQGIELTHLPEQQLLADVAGLSSECTLSVDFLPIIALQWNWDDSEGAHDYQVSGCDVLQWDTTKDITQFGWLHEMCSVVIRFHDQDGKLKKQFGSHSIGDGIVTSHAFLIVRISAEQEGVDEIPETNDVFAPHLKQAQYAKDLLVAPLHGGCMKLRYISHADTSGIYRFPAGYGLLLRYQNETRSV